MQARITFSYVEYLVAHLRDECSFFGDDEETLMFEGGTNTGPQLGRLNPGMLNPGMLGIFLASSSEAILSSGVLVFCVS